MTLAVSTAHNRRTSGRYCQEDQFRQLWLMMEKVFEENNEDLGVFSVKERRFYLVGALYMPSLMDARYSPSYSGVLYFFWDHPDAYYRELLESLTALGEDLTKERLERVKALLYGSGALPAEAAERVKVACDYDPYRLRLCPSKDEDRHYVEKKIAELDHEFKNGSAIAKLMTFARRGEIISSMGLWINAPLEEQEKHSSRIRTLRRELLTGRPDKVDPTGFPFSDPPHHPSISREVAEKARQNLARLNKFKPFVVLLFIVVASLLVFRVLGLMGQAGDFGLMLFFFILLGIVMTLGMALFFPLGLAGAKIVNLIVQRTKSWRVQELCMDFNRSWRKFLDKEAGLLREWIMPYAESMKRYEAGLAEWLELRGGGKLTEEFRKSLGGLVRRHYLIGELTSDYYQSSGMSQIEVHYLKSIPEADLQTWQRVIVDHYLLCVSNRLWRFINMTDLEFKMERVSGPPQAFWHLIEPHLPYPEFIREAFKIN